MDRFSKFPADVSAGGGAQEHKYGSDQPLHKKAWPTGQGYRIYSD